MCLCLSVCMYLHVCMRVCVSVWLYVCDSVNLLICLCVYLSALTCPYVLLISCFISLCHHASLCISVSVSLFLSSVLSPSFPLLPPSLLPVTHLPPCLSFLPLFYLSLTYHSFSLSPALPTSSFASRFSPLNFRSHAM